MVGSVIVGTIGDRGIESVRLMIGAHQVVRCSFAGGVRRVGRVGTTLVEGRLMGTQRSIDLVGRDVMEAVGRHDLLVDPQRFRGFEQRVCANDVRSYEIIGTENRAIHVRLRGKVHQRIDLMLLEQRTYIGLVAYVPLDEQIARIACNVRKTVDIPGIRQRVEDHYPAFTRVGQPVVYEVRTDEAGAPGNEYVTRLEVHPASSSDCAANAGQVPGSAP